MSYAWIRRYRWLLPVVALGVTGSVVGLLFSGNQNQKPQWSHGGEFGGVVLSSKATDEHVQWRFLNTNEHTVRIDYLWGASDDKGRIFVEPRSKMVLSKDQGEHEIGNVWVTVIKDW